MRTTASIDMTAIIPVVNSRPETVKFEDKKSWLKFEGPTGLRLYISKTKAVREIHLSGFGKDMPGTVPPPKHNGAVQAHLDMSLPTALQTLAEMFTLIGSGELSPVRTTKGVKQNWGALVETSPATL